MLVEVLEETIILELLHPHLKTRSFLGLQVCCDGKGWVGEAPTNVSVNQIETKLNLVGL